jgi:hypothetical protein
VFGFVALLTLNLWSIGIIPSCPPLLARFFPYIGFPVCFLLLVSPVMPLCRCGRRAFLRTRRFFKRWALRIFMLCLELLYIPILTQAIPLVFAKPTGCGRDAYLQYDRAGSDPLFEFVNHTAVCALCSPSVISPDCREACGGNLELRLIEYPNLLLVQDVFWACGGLLAYCVIVWLLGIPALFIAVVHKNQRFVRHVFVYGGSVEAKWAALLSRVDSTGIFLFSVYKYNRSWWSVAIFGMRFGVMLITTVAGRVWQPAILVLPLWYAATATASWCLAPFLHRPNTLLNVGLYGANAIFAIIPVLSWAGVRIPDAASLPLAISLIAAPIICAIALLCCHGEAPHAGDPTVKHRPSHRRRPPTEYTEVEPAISAGCTIRPMVRRKTGLTAPLLDGADDRRPEFVGDPGPDCRIQAGWMDAIAEMEGGQRTEEFEVGENKLRILATQMYRALDVVLDGGTIAVLARALYWALIIGAVGFGWYVGAVRGIAETRRTVVCGE